MVCSRTITPSHAPPSAPDATTSVLSLREARSLGFALFYTFFMFCMVKNFSRKERKDCRGRSAFSESGLCPEPQNLCALYLSAYLREIFHGEEKTSVRGGENLHAGKSKPPCGQPRPSMRGERTLHAGSPCLSSLIPHLSLTHHSFLVSHHPSLLPHHSL